jgi:Na+/serine symporter
MPRKLFSIQYETFTQSTTTIFNASHEFVIKENKSKIQRWIFGMIIGSVPFLIILICWMFVSLCINNLVRFYQHRKHRYRHGLRTRGAGYTTPKINV